MSNNIKTSSGSTIKDNFILIVESSKALGTLLFEQIQERTPYQPLLVSDGIQALDIVRQSRPSLVLLDNYPFTKMNGVRLYDQFCTIKGREDIPAIIFIAHENERVANEERDVIWIKKVFEMDEVIQTIQVVLIQSDEHFEEVRAA